MKKAISLLLSAALAMSLASCASPLRDRAERPASPADRRALPVRGLYRRGMGRRRGALR